MDEPAERGIAIRITGDADAPSLSSSMNLRGMSAEQVGAHIGMVYEAADAMRDQARAALFAHDPAVVTAFDRGLELGRERTPDAYTSTLLRAADKPETGA